MPVCLVTVRLPPDSLAILDVLGNAPTHALPAELSRDGEASVVAGRLEARDAGAGNI